jgi:hypothetical protein
VGEGFLFLTLTLALSQKGEETQCKGDLYENEKYFLEAGTFAYESALAGFVKIAWTFTSVRAMLDR